MKSCHSCVKGCASSAMSQPVSAVWLLVTSDSADSLPIWKIWSAESRLAKLVALAEWGAGACSCGHSRPDLG